MKSRLKPPKKVMVAYLLPILLVYFFIFIVPIIMAIYFSFFDFKNILLAVLSAGVNKKYIFVLRQTVLYKRIYTLVEFSVVNSRGNAYRVKILKIYIFIFRNIKQSNIAAF